MSAAPSMQASMKHVLEVVFALPPDSAVHRAMDAWGGMGRTTGHKDCSEGLVHL